MAEYSVAEFKDEEVREFLTDLSKKVGQIDRGKGKYTGLLSAIVFSDVNEHFKEEKGSDGPWAKWSKAYMDKMQSEDKAGNKILQDSGRLRQNFKPTDVKFSQNGFLWFNDAKTKIGSFPYAWAHEEGDGKLPKREFMWLSDKAMEKISVQTLQFLIDEGL